MPSSSYTQRIANNVALVLAARISMALAVPFILKGWSWLDNKFDAIDKNFTEIERVIEKFDIIENRLGTVEQMAALAKQASEYNNGRLIALETKRESDVENKVDFQRTTVAQFNKLQEAMGKLSEAVSALDATVKSMTRQTSQPR